MDVIFRCSFFWIKYIDKFNGELQEKQINEELIEITGRKKDEEIMDLLRNILLIITRQLLLILAY